MSISVFDLFKIGIGPSSSHTVGPMNAAREFVENLSAENLLDSAQTVVVELFGSLAATGKGHRTDWALILGLQGYHPEKIDTEEIPRQIEAVSTQLKLKTAYDKVFDFDPHTNIVFRRTKSLPLHPNGMKFEAFNQSGIVLLSKVYYSLGGGFILPEEKMHLRGQVTPNVKIIYPFNSGQELLQLCESRQLKISQVVYANELSLARVPEIYQKLDEIWQAMNDSIDRGCRTEGILPGPLKVKRRAKAIFQVLTKRPEPAQDPLAVLDWVNLYAIAVNEENAAGSRVVTAPTNGAAGIIPAVLRYYDRFCNQSSTNGIYDALLTAAAIGQLYMQNASISGAEVGCQGEVGVACSMAAGGLVAALGGTPRQVEQAAEIAMEHNLGLTCDPIGGLVQIPCIERNAMGAVKAINAARIAISGDGHHYVSLDSVIRTMKQTGKDMKTKYKETSRGGLAVNVAEC